MGIPATYCDPFAHYQDRDADGNVVETAKGQWEDPAETRQLELEREVTRMKELESKIERYLRETRQVFEEREYEQSLRPCGGQRPRVAQRDSGIQRA